jgi:hypothetical protein
MPDKPVPKELETLLARLEKEWQELAHLLKSQGLPQARVIQVEKLLFRDEAGKYRGNISTNPDGSVGLRLTDPQGKAWAWLGVNQDGEVSLELKDRKGEIRFTVPGSPPPTQAEAAAAAAPERPPGGPGQAESPPPSPEEKLGDDANAVVLSRLEHLERSRRRQWWFRAPILAVLGLILGIQAYVLCRPHPAGPLQVHSLEIRDANGAVRASLGTLNGKVGLDLRDSQGKRRAALGLAPDGSPALGLYDREQRLRAELNLGPDGAPKLTLRENLSSPGQAKTKAAAPSSQPARPGTVTGSEGGTVASPPMGPTGSIAATDRDAAGAAVYVGSKTSNKYHYPTCKWAQQIRPGRLIIFHSVKEAQARHYIPCPVCKPPPLSP